MGVLKSLFSWLMGIIGFFVLLSGVYLFTSSFIVQAMDTEELYNIADGKIDILIDENLDKIKEEQNIPDLTSEQIADLKERCRENPNEGFCGDDDFLSGRITQDEAMKKAIKAQMDIRGQIESTKAKLPGILNTSVRYATPFYGVLVFTLGVLLVFISKFFDVMASLGTVFYETAFASFISAVNFRIVPYMIEKLASASMVGGGGIDPTKIFVEILLSWIGPAINKAFWISLVMGIVFVVFYIILFIYQKKSSYPEADLSS